MAGVGTTYPVKDRSYGQSLTAVFHGVQWATLAASVARRPCRTTLGDLARQFDLILDWASRFIRTSSGLNPRTWLSEIAYAWWRKYRSRA